jgi:hypothetical protein
MPAFPIFLIVLGVVGIVTTFGWAISLRRRGGIEVDSRLWWLLIIATGCCAGAASAGVVALF